MCMIGLRPLPPAPFVRLPIETPTRLEEKLEIQQAGRRSAVTAWIGGLRIHCGYHASGYVHMYSPHSFTSGHGAMGMTHVHDDGILPPRAVQVVLKVKTSTTWMWHYMRVGQVRLSSAGSQVKRRIQRRAQACAGPSRHDSNLYTLGLTPPAAGPPRRPQAGWEF